MNKNKELTIPVNVVEKAYLPNYGTHGASGADIYAHLEEDQLLLPGERMLVPSGVSYQIPEGYEIQIRPRSGLALKQGITVLNTPGTIDADYRGELFVLLIHHGKEPFLITKGMRIAQIVVAKVVQADFVRVEHLENTVRGKQGFGHTGTH